jgi:hypothetical protein
VGMPTWETACGCHGWDVARQDEASWSCKGAVGCAAGVQHRSLRTYLRTERAGN